MKFLKALLLVCLLGMSMGAQAAKKPKMQTIYIFGFSASFTDSVAFLTDVMKVDSAYILSNGFLADRTLYSLQLENHVLGNMKVQNSTNAVFFSTKKKVMDKKYDKVNRIYQRSENLALIYVGEDEFRFQPQQYIEDETISLYDDDSAATEEKKKADGSPEKGGKK